MHKTSSYFLQRFDPEGSSSGNTRQGTRFYKIDVYKSVSPVLYCLKKTPQGQNVAKSMMKFCAFEDCSDYSLMHIYA